MDSRHRPRRRPDEMACSVCREPVAPGRARILARREDLLFVEMECRACASVTLGFVFAADDELLPERLRLAEAMPVTVDDVLDMHVHLAAWQGDLRSLLADRPPGSDRR